MVISEFCILTKWEKRMYDCIFKFQIFIGIATIIFIVISLLIKDKAFQNFSILTLLSVLVGGYSLIEGIIKYFIKKDTLFQILFFKLIKRYKRWLKPNNVQTEICIKINEKIDYTHITITGKPFLGKTSTVFIYLSEYLLNAKNRIRNKQIYDIVYIDCKKDKSEVLKYFHKNKTCFPTLIIVDNFERMGKQFITSILNDIDDSLNPYIFIFDELDDEMQEKEYSIKFNNYFEEDKINDHFKFTYNTLESDQKILLLIIYYFSFTTTFVSENQLNNILNYKKSKFKNLIRHLIRKKFIINFPYNRQLYFLLDRKQILLNKSLFLNTFENKIALNKILEKRELYPECAWYCYIHLTIDEIKKMDKNIKQDLFSNAFLLGNYKEMLEQLLHVITFYPYIKSEFLYEIGTLYFYNGEQVKAFNEFNLYLKKIEDDKSNKAITLLKLIESTHGDSSNITIENNYRYISELKKMDSLFDLYAQYWELHISSEKGEFLLDNYENLLKKLILSQQIYTNKELHSEIIKRCYTDILRTYHILFVEPPKIILDNFKKYLKQTYSLKVYEYYNSLYVKANTLHYYRIPHAILNEEEFEENYFSALESYKNAISCDYQNKKSVTACELKRIDLLMFRNEKDYDYYEEKIINFQQNAAINNVQVHVAYCHTLLMKLYMIKKISNQKYLVNPNIWDENICQNRDTAIDIYQSFKNEYGTFRVKFISVLYSLIFESNKLSELEKLTLQKPNYKKERDIYLKIMELSDAHNLQIQFLITLLKAYPIIMQ